MGVNNYRSLKNRAGSRGQLWDPESYDPQYLEDLIGPPEVRVAKPKKKKKQGRKPTAGGTRVKQGAGWYQADIGE